MDIGGGGLRAYELILRGSRLGLLGLDGGGCLSMVCCAQSHFMVFYSQLLIFFRQPPFFVLRIVRF